MKGVKTEPTFWFMALGLWLFWIIITASLRFQELLVGALMALFISWLNNDLFFRRNERSTLDFRTLALYLRYTFHLIIAIVEANLQVALIVLNPKMPISPGMISFSLPYRKKLNKVILANSITLTPGTLTVLVKDENFVVHALTRKNAEEVVKWKLAKELAEIEERQEKQEKSLPLRSRKRE